MLRTTLVLVILFVCTTSVVSISSRLTGIGDECLSEEDCSNLGSLGVCIGAKCSCKPGFGVPSDDNATCLAIVNFNGGRCLEGQQCRQGTPGKLSKCTDNKCACSDEATHEPGYHKCYQRVEFVGEPCDAHFPCEVGLGEYSMCKNGTSSCLDSAIPSSTGKECILKAYVIGARCQEDRQCQLGELGKLSECVDGRCKCKTGSIIEFGKHLCLNLKQTEYVGEPCTKDIQCQETPGGHSECSGGRCACTRDAIPVDANSHCLPIVNFINWPCVTSQQCQLATPGKLSVCKPNMPVLC